MIVENLRTMLRSSRPGETWGRKPYQKWGVVAGTHVPLPTFAISSVSLEHEDIYVITYRWFLDHLPSLPQALIQALLPPQTFLDVSLSGSSGPVLVIIVPPTPIPKMPAS